MDRLGEPSSGILVDARWVGPHGIGRFAAELLRRFPPVDTIRGGPRPASPLDPVRLVWILQARRPRAFFSPGFNAPVRTVVPFVFTLHDLIPVRVPESASTAKRLYYQTVVLSAARRAHCILTVSRFSRDEILDWSGVAPERVLVVSPAPSPAFRPDGPRRTPGYPYLLYVGARKPHKNLSRLLRAFALAPIPRAVRLVLTGHPDPHLLKVARRLGMADRLEFIGTPCDEALAMWYRGALALLLPSLYEGFGLPAVEAMACGTPVVASGTTALPEVLGDAAVWVDPRDTQSITEGISRIVEDGALRLTLRSRGLARSSFYSWDQTAGQVWGLLSSMLPSC